LEETVQTKKVKRRKKQKNSLTDRCNIASRSK
jgi:hypothetical protein